MSASVATKLGADNSAHAQENSNSNQNRQKISHSHQDMEIGRKPSKQRTFISLQSSNLNLHASHGIKSEMDVLKNLKTFRSYFSLEHPTGAISKYLTI